MGQASRTINGELILLIEGRWRAKRDGGVSAVEGSLRR
jgi:hypothetical protein